MEGGPHGPHFENIPRASETKIPNPISITPLSLDIQALIDRYNNNNNNNNNNNKNVTFQGSPYLKK